MRLFKQILYSGVAFLILFLIAITIYFISFAPDPTCFDGKKNQNEQGVDCGGPCISCAIKDVKDIQVISSKIFKASDGIGVAITLQNPNVEFGAKNFSYKISLKNGSGEIIKVIPGNSFVYAGEMKYIVKPYIPYNLSQIANLDVQISNPEWVEISSFKKPSFDVLDVKTVKNSEDGFVHVDGKIQNNDAFFYSPVNIMAFLYSHKGDLVSASMTTVNNVEKFDGTNFSVAFPKDLNIYQEVFNAANDFPKNLSSGDSGNEVINLQAFLAEIGVLDRNPSGFYDDATTMAVKTLQVQFDIPVTGDFDDDTRQSVINMVSFNTNQELDEQNKNSVDKTKTLIYVEAKK